MAEKETINVELAGRIVKLMRSALNNSRIYPVGSQIVLNTVNQLHTVLQGYLTSSESFTISEMQHKMFIEGQDIKSISDTFITGIMADNEIQSIKFTRGLTLDEIKIFVEVFSRRKEQIKSGPGVIDLLKSKNVKNILPSQIKYIAVGEGEEVVKKVSSLVDQLQYDPQVFMTSLRDIYNSLDEIKDDKVKGDMTNLLARKLTALDPSQLRDFFERTLPPKIQESGLQEAVTQALTEEKIQDIFKDITQWYDDIKRNVSSEFEAAEQLTSLRNFINKILNSPAARNLPFRFYEELLRVGVLEQLPDFVQKEEPTLILKVDKLLEGESTELLDPEIRKELPRIVKQLLQADLEDMVNRLTSKIAENLNQISLKARSDTMRTLLSIFDIVIPFQKEKILLGLQQKFMSQVKTESDIDIFKGIAYMLGKRMFQLIIRGDYEGALPILSILKQHTIEGTEPDAEKRQGMQEVLTSFAGEVSPILVNDLKSGVEARQLYAQKVVVLLEDTMSNVLIQTIKETDDFRTRRIAAFMLKNTGDNSIKQFFETIDLSVSTDLLKKMIDVFEEFIPYDYSGKLIELLNYPDISVKKIALRQLVRLIQYASEELAANIKAVIIEKIKDKDVSQNAVRLTGELRMQEAVPALISIIDSAPVPLQEESCIALGTIGNPSAIPALVKLLKVKKSLFGGTSSAPDMVRTRAAWSLRYFSGADSEKALNEAIKDKSQPVRTAAAQSLEYIKKGKEVKG
ncbi:MAG: HEAT repeat domain-containing protein [Elusimicrobiota bacterium]